MTDTVKDWVGILAVFPLWFMMAGLWFGLAYALKRGATPRMRELYNGTAVALSISSAMGALIGLHCGEFMHLPFADPACHWSALQLTAWDIR
jgi:hypothetical protein